MNTLVMIADIVGSKDIVGRMDFQQDFKKKITRLNKAHAGKLVSPLTVTLGDEFQGVFSDASGLFSLIHEIQTEFRDVGLRFAIGIGNIVTKINTKQAIGMDGPAFHHAREAMEEAKKKKRMFYYSGPEKDAQLVNQMLAWIDLTVSKWKPERIEMLGYRLQGMNQKQIATKIAVTQPAVSQTLTQPQVQAIIDSEKEIENYFEERLKQ